MKHLSVKKIATSVARAEDVPALLDAQGVEFQPIDCVDWAADYPYAPKVEFRIAHKGDAVLIEYRVSEQSVAAVAPHDNGRVWEDSCCEFFFQPEGGNVYYNVETNCAGRHCLQTLCQLFLRQCGGLSVDNQRYFIAGEGYAACGIADTRYACQCLVSVVGRQLF